MKKLNKEEIDAICKVVEDCVKKSIIEIKDDRKDLIWQHWFEFCDFRKEINEYSAKWTRIGAKRLEDRIDSKNKELDELQDKINQAEKCLATLGKLVTKITKKLYREELIND